MGVCVCIHACVHVCMLACVSVCLLKFLGLNVLGS